MILDAWPTFGNQECMAKLDESGKLIEILRIPAHTTRYVQPLDLGFNMLWKTMKKKFDDHIVMKGINITAAVRDRELKIHPLIHNQFSNARFVDVIKYAWFTSGWLTQRPPRFTTPAQFCFRRLPVKCGEDNCTQRSFIRCAHCEKLLCFQQFYFDFHTHF